jgi:hypothetical protein
MQNMPRILFCSPFLAIVTALVLNCSNAGSRGSINSALPPTPVVFEPLVPPDGNTPMIVMSRGESAFGKGPVFKISIFGDGRVVYEPASDHPMPIYRPEKPTPLPTPAHLTISQTKLGEILQEVSAIDFLTMRDRYLDAGDGCPHVVSDQPSISVTVNLESGQTKTVRHYQGCLEDPNFISSVYPRPLKDLESKILSLTQ